jgi:hypothetical protein
MGGGGGGAGRNAYSGVRGSFARFCRAAGEICVEIGNIRWPPGGRTLPAKGGVCPHRRNRRRTMGKYLDELRREKERPPGRAVPQEIAQEAGGPFQKGAGHGQGNPDRTPERGIRRRLIPSRNQAPRKSNALTPALSQREREI